MNNISILFKKKALCQVTFTEIFDFLTYVCMSISFNVKTESNSSEI